MGIKLICGWVKQKEGAEIRFGDLADQVHDCGHPVHRVAPNVPRG